MLDGCMEKQEMIEANRNVRVPNVKPHSYFVVSSKGSTFH